MTKTIEVICCRKEEEISEPFYKQAWRPAAAGIYLLICLFDFIIMPSIIEYQNDKIDRMQAITQTLKFKSPSVRQTTIEVLLRRVEWSPKTLGGGGMFHLAFGALLVAAAFTRGQDKIQRNK